METSFDTFGPLMVEQLREQVSNLLAAVHLLTPVIRDERYDQYLAIMNQSLYRLLRLTGNIEFAALPRGAEDLRSAPLDLAGLCRDLSSEVIPLAERAGVVFRYEESCSSLLTSGDAVLLRRMLLNLISNALRAAGAGGEAGLRFTAYRERCTLTIWDSGSGFDSSVPDPEDLTRRPDGAGEGNVDQDGAEAHGQQQGGLKPLLDGQPDQKAAHDVHQQLLPCDRQKPLPKKFHAFFLHFFIVCVPFRRKIGPRPADSPQKKTCVPIGTQVWSFQEKPEWNKLHPCLLAFPRGNRADYSPLYLRILSSSPGAVKRNLRFFHHAAFFKETDRIF